MENKEQSYDFGYRSPKFQIWKKNLYDFVIIFCFIIGLVLSFLGLIVLAYDVITGQTLLMISGITPDFGNVSIPLPLPLVVGIGFIGIGLKFGK